jgi:hypothetical protein
MFAPAVSVRLMSHFSPLFLLHPSTRSLSHDYWSLYWEGAHYVNSRQLSVLCRPFIGGPAGELNTCKRYYAGSCGQSQRLNIANNGYTGRNTENSTWYQKIGIKFTNHHITCFFCYLRLWCLSQTWKKAESFLGSQKWNTKSKQLCL